MTLGAKVAFLFYGAMLAWDKICPKKQTLSEAAARGLADKRTRWPLGMLLVGTLVHLFALAHSYVKPPPLGSPGNLGLERYEGLRQIGFM